ncbi:hypothetical protein CRENBAI_016523 [Crenichthys baileyi]|uniref:Uncharacterized protein n=1 Tax=Crenichthys baileyi TaxID=28760 RepID=A0AAV9S6S2_9TELE
MERVTVLYLWYAKTRRQRRHPWVHQRQNHFGEYHHLLLEQCLVDGRFQRYFCLSRTQFEDLLSHVGGRISPRDTSYRCWIPAAEHLPHLSSQIVWPTGDNAPFPSMRHQIRGASAACRFQLNMERVTVLYLWYAKTRRQRRHPWVHQRQNHFGEYHHLLLEQCLVDGRFQRYFCLSRTQFEDLLSHVGGRISPRDTIYRCWIPAAEHLPICLR